MVNVAKLIAIGIAVCVVGVGWGTEEEGTVLVVRGLMSHERSRSCDSAKNKLKGSTFLARNNINIPVVKPDPDNESSSGSYSPQSISRSQDVNQQIKNTV